MEGLKGLLVLVLLLLVSVEHSECVRCFKSFDVTLGTCNEEIGEVDEEACCRNPHYGYMGADGACQFCGPPVWSPWSSWSQCNKLCGEGVRQSRRRCFNKDESQCEKASDNLHVEACNGTCCDGADMGWGPWLNWSPCSVSCGGVGVRKRERKCTSRPECQLACTEPSQETEKCEARNTCPVHGVWAPWSKWFQCSGDCIDESLNSVPTRIRQRSCSNPAPSSDTVPPGNNCPGKGSQTQLCSELRNCLVDGRWGEWSSFGPCSVSCGEGLKLSKRMCDSPAPKYGGQYCEGPSTRSDICKSPCPVHGLWTGWSSWGECSASCIPQGQAPVRTRHRSCSNPAPSSAPPGQDCEGSKSQTENCNHLPHCPVDGIWGSWSSFAPCSVTCGVGIEVSLRQCNNPAPKHGGLACSGSSRKTRICSRKEHCPVDGMWSDWSEWQKCKYPGSRNINCEKIGGSQIRYRRCLHQDYNGSMCLDFCGDRPHCRDHSLTDTRVCYDVHNCKMKGNWDSWEPWSLCNPPCGGSSRAPSRRFRKKTCKADFSGYRDEEWDAQYEEFLQAEPGKDSANKASNQTDSLDQKHRERWEETVDSIDFTYRSRLAWKILKTPLLEEAPDPPIAQ
ncbi:properdin-like [Pholidichthys leucotaenia]